MKRIIYALKCPFMGSVHYIGKSSQGMVRPLQHLTKSHSKKINQWVDDLKVLGYKPIIEILHTAKDFENLDNLERSYISVYLNDGAYLLNEALVTPIALRRDLEERITEEGVDKFKRVGKFIAIKRKEVNLTQEEFADRAGVALTVIRKIEQGKTNLNVNGLLEVLSMFGCTLQVVESK